MDTERALEASLEARTQAWSSWGQVDGDVLGHLINPSFMGGPRWPAMRQAFRVVRRPGAILVASDGLSDPFDDPEAPSVNGYGLEVYALTADPLEELKGRWLFQMVWQVSQLCADNGGVRALIDELKLISTEVYDVNLPEAHAQRFVNEHGRVGVLLGLVEPPLPALIDGPLSDIRLLNARLLTLEELAYAVKNKDAGRAELARRFAEQPLATGSSLTRASVV